MPQGVAKSNYGLTILTETLARVNAMTVADYEKLIRPVRVQRKRTKGWKMPLNTLYAGRPSKWGNPFVVGEITRSQAKERFRECLLVNESAYYWFEEIQATIEYERFKWMKENIKTLKGKNLACFCSLDCECHVDDLLDLANSNLCD